MTQDASHVLLKEGGSRHGVAVHKPAGGLTHERDCGWCCVEATCIARVKARARQNAERGIIWFMLSPICDKYWPTIVYPGIKNRIWNCYSKSVHSICSAILTLTAPLRWIKMPIIVLTGNAFKQQHLMNAYNTFLWRSTGLMVYCGVIACVPASVLFCFMETQQQHGGTTGLLFCSGHSGLAASISGVVWKSDSPLNYATSSFLPVEGAKYFN